MDKKGGQLLYHLICSVLIIIIFFNFLFLFSTAGLKEGQLPRIFGYTPLIENTGSMEPVMTRGDLIFVKEAAKVKEGDVIAWHNQEGGITTHRIVRENSDGTFNTKGDSNNVEDRASVNSEQIIGIYCAKLAKAGYLLMYLQKPQGIISIILLILFSGVLVLWWIEHKENKKLRER